jgi:hypothetical protein
MTNKRLWSILAAILVVAAAGVVVFLLFFSEVPTGSFRLDYRIFQPERIVLSEARIGQAIGTLEDDLYCEPVALGVTIEMPDTIPAGTRYYAVEGFDERRYLALPYEGFYFLYSTSPNKRIVLEPLLTDDSLEAILEEYAGTQAQACYEAFTYSANYQMDYCAINISKLQIDDSHALLNMILAYCDQRGIAVMFPYDDMLQERGYWTGGYYGGLFQDGLSISLYAFQVGIEELDPNRIEVLEDGTIVEHLEDGSVLLHNEVRAFLGEVSVEVGTVAGGLAGDGTIYVLGLKDGSWVVRDSEMTWIS